jgi:hypothetical protein
MLRFRPIPIASEAINTSYPLSSRLLKSSACFERASGGSEP